MSKQIPNLQVALDHSDLQGAIKAAVSVGHEVDVIEAGTVCLLQVGSELVEVLRSLFPEKIIVADTKCADAGGTVAKNNAVRGADWMTCICSATIPTMKAALKAIQEERGQRGKFRLNFTETGPMNKLRLGWMQVFPRLFTINPATLFWLGKLGEKRILIRSRS